MTQPEALRLAELWEKHSHGYALTPEAMTAAELRRQHEENEGLRRERDEARRTVREAHEAGTRLTAQRDALLEALRELLTDAEFLGWGTAKARAAIKQAEGEKT